MGRLQQAELIIEIQGKSPTSWAFKPTNRQTARTADCRGLRTGARVGVVVACKSIGVARATLYRRRRPLVANAPRPTPPRALTKVELLDLLHDERFVDKAPAQVYATLLDEGKYHCSVRAMYRILAAMRSGSVGTSYRHPAYSKPELLATGPNQVWSWDIAKLKGPAKWNFYYLYVIIDIYSRYVVGWMVATNEGAELAKRLIHETFEKQSDLPGQLVIHAARGSSMSSKAVALMLADLVVTKTHSRPHTSNDNPYSEAQFKTLKYRPDSPQRFGSIEDARAFCQVFFTWYNREHRHSGIGLLTPEDLHYGHAKEVMETRRRALRAAYAAHPERFVRKAPQPPVVPDAAWVNKPNSGAPPVVT